MVRFSLRQCAYFRAVAEHGGIAQAARMLNLTQPSVAEGIRKLEESTGLRLFDRMHARGTTLTLQGRAFLDHVISLEEHAGQVQREADALASRTAGHIRLGCFHTLAPFFSPGLVQSHAAGFPGVSISTRELSLSAIAAGLREGELDVALTYDQGSDLGGLVVRKLVVLTPKVVVSSGHRLAGQGTIRLQDLTGEPYVMFDGPGSRDYFEALLRRHDLAPFTAYVSTSLEAVRTAVGQGFGFTLLVMNPGTTTYDGRQVSILAISDDVRPLWIVLAYRTPARAEPLLEDFLASAVRLFPRFVPGRHPLLTIAGALGNSLIHPSSSVEANDDAGDRSIARWTIRRSAGRLVLTGSRTRGGSGPHASAGPLIDSAVASRDRICQVGAMRYTLRQLEYFIAAGETGSITLAAERIAISQPSISAAIAHLEREWKAQLFIRHHAQGLSLTQVGRTMLRESKIVVGYAAGLYAAASASFDQVRGALTFGCMTTLAPMLLPSIVRSFGAAFPGVQIRTVEGNAADLCTRLTRAEIDVALAYDLGLTQEVAFEPLASLPPHVVVGEIHPLAARSALERNPFSLHRTRLRRSSCRTPLA